MSSITTINAGDLISGSRTDINTNFSNLNTDKEEVTNKDTDGTLAANSDTKYPSQKAVKTYADSVSSPTGRSWNDYAVDAVGTDAYAITLTGFTAYVAGQTFKFKAGTANTGACSLKVNGLAVIPIKKDVSSDLATGDILANQIVTVIYDGTNMQLQSQEAGIAKTADLPTEAYTVGALRNALVKTYFNIQLPFILWTGAVVNDTTTTFENWVRSSAEVVVSPSGLGVDFQGTALETITAKIFPDNWGVKFNTTQIIISDFWAKWSAATDTGDTKLGFMAILDAVGRVYTDTAYDYVGFTKRGSTGVLYASIAKGSTGVTNTDISSGLTLTNWNNFRIELDLSNNALFYVNGVLKATLSGANLPTTNSGILLGFGRSDTALFLVTAPTISLQMNP